MEKMKPNELKEVTKIIEFLENEIHCVPFHIKKGNHINIIDDKIYFSVVGYNVSESEYNEYLEWEKTRFYLRSIASKLGKTFYNLDINILDDKLLIVPKNQ